ncbi:enolase C-terminal domain-like protein [Tenggerimyces flavus]|uniref:Enolase C-terminal domain-like protein n=1 Tax=Tenggerimyces flavus TaxID=1708749 RepID=A0ABV7YKW6_9ACTN|nr:enolase C-terminal domain-like protein [Tenggerimyces flavus]MBM7784771.1 L-alanine-DL-glutamate epimerase-like enolase superfamily enzyme [Tenggerimyces flavus]
MRSSDITILESEVDFEAVELSTPLILGSGAVKRFTVARVRVVAADRQGRTATGTGTSVLSVPWSWPRSTLSFDERDIVLRDLCVRLAGTLSWLEAADPIRLCGELSATLPELARPVGAEPVPQLAALLCLGAVDNAVHDAWSRVAGGSAYHLYTADYLNDDLGAVDSSLAGRYPGEFLTAPRERLPVQHVVSPGDPLTPADRADGYRPLVDWCRTERLRHFKIKVLGRDPHEDADRIGAVYDTVRAGAPDATLAVDPNESYSSLEALDELADALRKRHPDAASAIAYVEQPIPRSMALVPRPFPFPVLMDEGSSDLGSLPELARTGWSGLVVKAGKGQTYALVANAYAKVHGLFLTVQDLTTVDLALRHSARLASVLHPSAPHLEYNSRQYAPHANARLSVTHPELTGVRDGAVRVGPLDTDGIY